MMFDGMEKLMPGHSANIVTEEKLTKNNNRIDCTQVLNFKTELRRMCQTYMDPDDYSDCGECPLWKDKCISEIDDITQEHVDIVQKWSDEHPSETMIEKFFKMFPNAPKSLYGYPTSCPDSLGWAEKPKPCGHMSCKECWNRPYKGD